MKKKAKAEAERQSTIKFHVLRLIHCAKPAFRSQTNGGSFLIVSVDLRIWASIEQGRGRHVLALVLFGWEWVQAEGLPLIEDHMGEPTLVFVGKTIA